MARKITWNWGTGIFLVIVLFVAGMATMVTIVQKWVHIDLVAKDYYEQEIAYQGEIDRQQRGISKAERPDIMVDTTSGGHVRVRFPEGKSVSEVVLELTKPDDASLDQNRSLTPNVVSALALPKSGAWKMHLTWKSAGESCAMALGTKTFE
jgi:hypothetical protein